MDQVLIDYLTKKRENEEGLAGLQAQAMQAANQNTLMSTLGQAASNFSSAASGTKADNSFYNNLSSQAQSPLAQIELLKKSENDRLSNLLNEYKLAKESRLAEREEKKQADLYDPKNKNAISKAKEYKAMGISVPENATLADLAVFDPIYSKKADADKAEKIANLKAEFAIDKAMRQKTTAQLGGEDKKRYDSAVLGYEAAKEMKDALINKNQNTFRVWGTGDNDFTFAKNKFSEAIGRMQSGGAINDKEAERFLQMAPGATDSTEIQKKKLEWIEAEMARRIKTMGFNPDTVELSNQSNQPQKEVDTKQTMAWQEKAMSVLNNPNESPERKAKAMAVLQSINNKNKNMFAGTPNQNMR